MAVPAERSAALTMEWLGGVGAVMTGVVAVFALWLNRRDRVADKIGELDTRLTSGIAELSERVARVEGHLGLYDARLVDRRPR